MNNNHTDSNIKLLSGLVLDFYVKNYFFHLQYVFLRISLLSSESLQGVPETADWNTVTIMKIQKKDEGVLVSADKL